MNEVLEERITASFSRRVVKDFGYALEALQQGYPVTREGWNGKGMSVSLEHPPHPRNPCFALTGSDGRINTWVPSVSDCLAEDWITVQ